VWITTESYNGHDFNKLQNLMNMNIVNSSIQILPNIFSNLGNLNQLQLDSNPISSIPNNVFPLNFSSNFWFLMLRNTTLTTVPTALSKLTNLNRIDFQRHSIQEIHDDDFKHLEKLEMYFTDNLLQTVSDNAFQDLKSLNLLFLDNTKLTTIPKAVINLPSLFQLTLSNTRIDCTCENLGWIKDWTRRSDLEIYGSCGNIRMTIGFFISQELPKCK
jgi:Leucine-rich repeat (LRR) protein